MSHREVFENLVEKQEEKRKDLINEAHGVALEENTEIDGYEAKVRELKGEAGVEKEKTELGLEEIKARFTPFLTETFTKWYDKETAEKVEQKLSLIKPEDIDWEALKNDIDASKFGEYSLNPETQGLDFESFPPEKIKVLELFDLKEMDGHPFAEVGKYLVTKYGATHYLPGIEYWQYIIENPDKAPASLKDGNSHYFFGSTLRDQDGGVSVPDARWGGDRFSWHKNGLDGFWHSTNSVQSPHRAVLLEK